MVTNRFAHIIQEILQKKVSLLIFFCVTLITGAIIFWAIFPNQSPAWTGFGEYQSQNGVIERSKTLWDWMNLLIVPLALAIGVYILNKAEKNNEQQIAKERLLESTLQDYLDRMTVWAAEQNGGVRLE